ncbi:hypothetical protein AUP68_07360 [Ilyonectria robusta]
MPQIPNKRSQPRKYGSKEEKARQDVIARRARRRLQSTAAREDTRFKIYTTPNVKKRRSATLLQQKGASTHRSPALEPSPATRPGAGLFAPQNVSCDSVDTQLRSPEPIRVGMLPSCDILGNTGFASLDNSSTYSALACQPEYTAGTPAMNEDGGDQLLFGNPDSLAGANTEIARSDPGNESENESGERQQDGELQDPTQDDQGRVANLDYQSEDGFEADSNLQSDNSDTSNHIEVDNHLNEIAESNYLYAKEFLEKIWDYFCNCREEENIEWGGRPVLSLE